MFWIRVRRWHPGALILAAVAGWLVFWPTSASSWAAAVREEGRYALPHDAPSPGDTVHVLIVYHSMTGNTEKMARAVAEGVRSISGALPTVRRTDAVTADDLSRADAIILGSPTYWGNIAGPMKAFIDDWSFKYKVSFVDKVGGAFASGGGETGGKEHVLSSLDLALLNGGAILVGPVERGLGAGGVTAVSPVNGAALAECRRLGQRVAEVASRVSRQSRADGRETKG